MTIVALGAWDPAPVAVPTLLIAMWLCAGALVRTIDLAVGEPQRMLASLPAIPVRFVGPTGRYAVRIRDRHRIEVLADRNVVATIVSNDGEDEITVYDVPPAESPALDELGTAVGHAISIASVWGHSVRPAPGSAPSPSSARAFPRTRRGPGIGHGLSPETWLGG